MTSTYRSRPESGIKCFLSAAIWRNQKKFKTVSNFFARYIHQQHAITDHIAWQMFNDARRSLKYGGELYVVGNRHLDYFRKLKRAFGNCTTIATNNKFVILKATKVRKQR